jgi:capsular polysaccharide transport system ATP-binding protein
MIKIDNVSKGYRTNNWGWKQVLKAVSLDIPDNMNLGILGRNGAGKSTLIRLICGLDVPDKGGIETYNRRMSWPLGAAAGVHGSMTGRENIKFMCRIYNINFEETFDFIESFADLKEYMYMPVKTYSSGMKSRLGFGMSMAIEFDTYVVDEGFSAGDARFKEKTKEMFDEKLKKSNMIVVSHNPSTIKKFCTHGAVLSNGELVLYDKLDDAIKAYSNL